MGEALRFSSETTADTASALIDNALADYEDLFETEDDVAEEESREKTISEVQERLGSQQYSYPPYVGTISDIIRDCPAVEAYIVQGPDAVVGFVSGKEVTNEEAERLRNPTIEDEEAIEDPVMKVEELKLEKPSEDTEKKKVVEIQDKQEIINEPEQVIAITNPTSLPVQPVIVSEKPAEAIRPTVDVANRNEALVIDRVLSPDPVIEMPSTDKQTISPLPRTEQLIREFVDTVQPEVVEKNPVRRVEITLPELSAPVEKIEPIDRVVVPVEHPVQHEVAIEPEVIEQIDVETISAEVFHMPEIVPVKIEAEVSVQTPELDEVESDEIIESEIDANFENEPDDELLGMDLAVEQIETAEETDGQGMTDKAEVVEQESESAETETAANESDIMIETEPTILGTALEHEQTEQFETEAVGAAQHEAIIEVSTELVGAAPNVEVATYSREQIQNLVATVARHIEVLQKSKNEQECREAIIGLRKELADLLTLLGYRDVDVRAERIIRNNHDMVDLKRIMESLLQAAIVDETISDDVQVVIKPYHKFGQWVVGRTTTILQAA